MGPSDLFPPPTKKQRIIPPPPVPPSVPAPVDRLGKCISDATTVFLKSTSWPKFISQLRGPNDLQHNILATISHPAAPLLNQIAHHGVPVLQRTPLWSQSKTHSAMTRGSHPSTHARLQFLREEMADMVEQHFWVVIPYKYICSHPYLRISPMGVIPQRDRRDRVIVDYSFSNVNVDTVPIAPSESMQFGRTLDRILYKIYHAHQRYGPVYMIKIDIADGFYRLPVSSSHIPTLAVVFPHLPGEEPLVALPLVLPMGWVSSPPLFLRSHRDRDRCSQ
jgi:hypothetical protein